LATNCAQAEKGAPSASNATPPANRKVVLVFMAVILVGGLLAPRRQELTRQPDRIEKTPIKPI
jgi:hypothetical protein